MGVNKRVIKLPIVSDIWKDGIREIKGVFKYPN